MKTVNPLADRLLIRTVKVEQSTGGIYIPDTAKNAPQDGVVLAVGPGRYLEDGTFIPTTVSVGDKIIFGKYSGHEVKIDDENLLIISEKDVLAVIQ